MAFALKNKTGLEIGGPSKFFDLKSYFPIYVFAKRIDGVNYSSETVWEGKIKTGRNYNYGNGKKGFQFIDEASELKNVQFKSYDFLLSCHSLEHVANPLKAIERWSEFLKPGGALILVLPDKNYTFDVNRSYTTFEHLLEDYKKGISEDDKTHFEEVIKLHKIDRDPSIHSVEELLARIQNNISNRCVHHHVFSLELMEEMLSFFNFEIKYKQKVSPFHLVMIAEKKELKN
jgi:SAM-dependent methyltransferase